MKPLHPRDRPEEGRYHPRPKENFPLRDISSERPRPRDFPPKPHDKPRSSSRYSLRFRLVMFYNFASFVPLFKILLCGVLEKQCFLSFPAISTRGNFRFQEKHTISVCTGFTRTVIKTFFVR